MSTILAPLFFANSITLLGVLINRLFGLRMWFLLVTNPAYGSGRRVGNCESVYKAPAE